MMVRFATKTRIFSPPNSKVETALGPIHPPIQLGIGSLSLGIKRSSVKLTTYRYTDLYSSANIVRVIKSRMRWVGSVAGVGEGEAYTGFRWGKLRERDHLGDPSIDGRIIR